MGLSMLGCQGLLAFARSCGHLPCVLGRGHLPCARVPVTCRNFSLHNSYCASSTYYDDLEITPQATSKQIKEAYFTLSKKYHPDVTANDEILLRKFQSVSEAYGVLSNPKLRRAYDTGQLGHDSSVADREVSTHQFDQEKFYDSRASQRLKAARGQANLDDWVMEHRSDTFRRNKHNIIKNRGNMKNAYGSQGMASHNRATNNPATDRIIAKFFGYAFLTLAIMFFLFR